MSPSVHTRRESNPSPSNTQGPKTGRILAIDYGRKRIGLALSDELWLTARPLETIVRTNRRNDLRRLREVCRKHGVTRIVVGLPLHMTGESGPMAEEASRFAARVGKELGIQVELADERLTTWEAEQMMDQPPGPQEPPRGRRRPLDEVAAAILLRGYLEQQRHRDGVTAAEKD